MENGKQVQHCAMFFCHHQHYYVTVTIQPYALCVIFTIVVSLSQDNALFASKAKINVV